MHKKLLLTLTLFSISNFTLNFDKEFSEFQKTARKIGSDSWDRASFEDNALKRFIDFYKCTEEKPKNSQHALKCNEILQKEINKQLSNDTTHLLRLLIAGLIIDTIGKSIEHAASTITNDHTASNLKDSLTLVPNTIIGILTVPLSTNVLISMITKIIS